MGNVIRKKTRGVLLTALNFLLPKFTDSSIDSSDGICLTTEDREKSGLTYYYQMAARDYLKHEGILGTTYRHIPRKVYYHMDVTKAQALLEEIQEAEQNNKTWGSDRKGTATPKAILETETTPSVVKKLSV